jgi:hypothetical protein
MFNAAYPPSVHHCVEVFSPEWNLVPHSTAQYKKCCAVCCAVFESWISSAVKSCVIAVQHLKNSCVKVLYFDSKSLKTEFSGSFFDCES